PSHHPAMRHAAPVRRELATRTVFNVLGPLTNPAGARAQVVGVYSRQLVRTIAEVLAQLGTRRAYVVHGAGGIDELSPAGPNLVAEVVNGSVRERELDPEAELGVPRCSVDELRGGTPAENAAAVREIFDGADRRRRDLDPRRRALRGLARRSEGRTSRHDGAAAREGLLHRGARPAQAQGRRRGSRARDPARRRRPARRRAALVRTRAGDRDARR